MTVIDTSGVIDFLLGVDAAAEVEAMLEAEGELAAPDLLVFEVLAALRRVTRRGSPDAARATAAVDDLGGFPVMLFPALPLRHRAWELRQNLTAADALFVTLAEALDEPLATKDRALARAASDCARVEVVSLAPGG